MTQADVITRAGPAPAGVRWVTVDEAKRRSGESVRTLRRWCEEKWEAAGFAKMQTPGDGRKCCWHIREDADPRLCRGVAPEHIPFNRGGLTDEHRKLLDQRLRVVTEWDAWRANGHRERKTDEQIDAAFVAYLGAEGIEVSRKTLYEWRGSYREKGQAGLVDGRWLPKRTVDRAEDPFIQFIKDQFLTLKQRSFSACYQDALDAAAVKGWPVLHERTARREIQKIPREVLILKREGEKAWEDTAGPYIERDYSGLASNAMWVADHHQFDVWVITADGERVRPWLSAFMDMASRKLVGWIIRPHAPNTESVLRSLAAGIETHGRPAKAYMDNGKDYRAFALQGDAGKAKPGGGRRKVIDGEHAKGVLAEMGIAVVHARPYNAKAKPIERLFGTIEKGFGDTWATYCGGSPLTRPEDLPVQLARGNAPTLENFAAEFGAWVANVYHKRPHHGQGMDLRTPEAAWKEKLAARTPVEPEVLRRLVMVKTRPTKVGQNGVEFMGVRYGRGVKAVQDMLGQQVILRVDPDHAGEVRVYALDGRFVCTAPANQRVLADADPNTQDLRDQIAEQKRRKKAAKAYHEMRPRIGGSFAHQVAKKANDRRKADAGAGTSPTPTPPASLPIRPLLTPAAVEERKDIGRAERRKVAVGAESIDPSDALMAMYERRNAERRAAADAGRGGSLLDLLPLKADAADGRHQ